MLHSIKSIIQAQSMVHQKSQQNFSLLYTILLAPKGFESQLNKELDLLNIPLESRLERLFIIHQDRLLKARRLPIWIEDIWYDTHKKNIESISEAQKELRNHHKTWLHFSGTCHRRGELIASKLKTIASKRLSFLETISPKPFGIYFLLDKNTLFYSTKPTSINPLGYNEFKENKLEPPSRAYLKLWEFFTLQQSDFAHRLKNKEVFDMGACPGGWTYVLQSLGAKVCAVDKAPLDPSIAKLPNVIFQKNSAFSIEPTQWLQNNALPYAFFSDMACYPERLLTLVHKWKNAGVKNFVCTLKFQGETNFSVMEEFLQIAPSQLVHLYHNKHELTWVCLDTEFQV